MMGRGKKFKAPKISTVIGQGTEITGDVNFSGGLHLDGIILGNINGVDETKATLTVSEKGKVEGDVRVENLILNGSIVGDVYVTERAELAADARVTGTVYYRVLEMAGGAEVNGQLVHKEDPEQRMLGYDGKKEKNIKKSHDADKSKDKNDEKKDSNDSSSTDAEFSK